MSVQQNYVSDLMQAVSVGGLTAAEGASKLVAYLQDLSLTRSSSHATPVLLTMHSQSQPSDDFTFSPSEAGSKSRQESLGKPLERSPDFLNQAYCIEDNMVAHCASCMGDH